MKYDDVKPPRRVSYDLLLIIEKMSKYKKQQNRNVEAGIISLACCDCGLIHKMGFTSDDKGILRLDFERDNRATAQIRRGNFPYLKNPQKGAKWAMVRCVKKNNKS